MPYEGYFVEKHYEGKLNTDLCGEKIIRVEVNDSRSLKIYLTNGKKLDVYYDDVDCGIEYSQTFNT